MRLVRFDAGMGSRLGAEQPDGIIDLTGGGFPSQMEDFIRQGPEEWARAEAWLKTDGQARIERSKARILAPLRHPGKIIGIGMNYADHVRETKAKMPERPILFAMYDNAIIGPDEMITWSPEVTHEVDWEVELGVIMGRRARNVSEADALDYVFGYTVVNDVSARDLQFSDGQWVRSKTLDSFCPVGPAIVTANEIPDPQKLGVATRVNGELMQCSNTSEMIFGVRSLIAFISRSFTLEPGDLISTGTTGGVGFTRKPPVFLKDGDRVEVEVEKIGVLKNQARTI